MAGLRAKSKQRRRQAILEAAEQLFRRQGYERTTIEEIAGNAEVSIGTLYSYFGSKGGILRDLMEPVIEDMKSKGQALIDSPPARAVDAISALYEAYRFGGDWKHLNLLKAFDPRTRSSDAELEGIVSTFEAFIKAQIAAMLISLQRAERLSERVDVEDATFLIYMVLISHFENHLRSDGATTYEGILVDAHRRLRLLFEQWS